jgi:polysaccharide biosynthesis transport protein
MVDSSPRAMQTTRPGFGSTRDLLSLVFRRKLIALAIFILIFLASVFSLARQKVVYMAETKILVLRGSGGASGPLTGPRLQWWEEMRTEVQLVRSRPVAERAAAQLERKWKGEGLSMKGEGLRMSSPELAALEPPPAEDLLEAMMAEPIEETNIIRITYHALDGRTAIDAVNAIATGYLEHRREMKRNRQTAGYFEEALERRRSTVARLRAEIALYKTQHGITDIAQETDELLHQRAQVEADLTDARGRRAELESELKVIDRARLASPGVLVPTIDLASYETLKNHQRRLAELEGKLNSLRSTYTEESPPVQAVVRDAEAARQLIRQAVDELAAAKRNQLEVLRGRESSLDSELGGINTILEQIPEHEARVAFLQMEISTATAQLGELELQHQAHRLQEEVDPRLSNLQLVSPAISAKRVGGGSKQKLFMVFSFLLAAGMALVAAFMVDTLDHTIKFPADVESALGIPVLGSVREVKVARRRAARQAGQAA